MDSTKDTVLRAITDDGAFRVITTRTTNTVKGAIAAQNGSGPTARHFADLLTASVLFRETMAPQLRVQGIIKRAGTGSLVADSHPSGMTRGLIQLAPGTDAFEMADNTVLQLMRTLPSGRINQGFVRVGAEGGISHAFMEYMQVSEQVDTMLAVDSVFDDGQVVAAGGYMVQLLPEVGRGPLMIMTERLRDFESIAPQLRDASFSPTWLLDQLLYGMPFTRLEESDVDFDCWCDELRVMSALASLGRATVEELVSDGEVLHMTCDYCGTEYQIAPSQLRGLLAPS